MYGVLVRRVIFPHDRGFDLCLFERSHCNPYKQIPMNKSSIELFAIALYEKGFLQGNGNEINDLLEHYKNIYKQEIIETHFNAQEFNAMMLHSAEKYYKSVFEKL
jgi:hypothetical protein